MRACACGSHGPYDEGDQCRKGARQRADAENLGEGTARRPRNGSGSLRVATTRKASAIN